MAQKARGQALQDLMEGRERQRPSFIDTQAGLDNPGNMAVQAAKRDRIKSKEYWSFSSWCKPASRAIITVSEISLLRACRSNKSHNIVHLATHGIAYGDDALASLIAFSPTDEENGLLTAREVMQTSSLPADLVVLSACQTGLGRISGEGMLGLCRAFLVAGARSVVVSQWSVSDRATMELMSAFYQQYLQSGNKAVALQQAMQIVRSQAEYSHPRYWASFIVVGAEE